MKKLFIKLLILILITLVFQVLFLMVKIHSFEQLAILEKAKKENVDVIYFGDSSASNYGLDDSDKRPLPQMLKEILTGHTMASIDSAAYAAEVFLEFSKHMINEKYYPEFVVIPVNMRSFSPSWDKNPGYQFEDQKAILKSKLLFMFLKTTEAFDKKSKLNEITQEEFENTEVFNGEEVVGTAKEFEGHEFRHYSEENMKNSILYFYMFSLKEDNDKLGSLSEIARILLENNIKPIFYITPVDYETGERYFPGEFSERLKNNVETIKSVLKENDINALDLSMDLKPDFFAWERYPNEHLNEKGRKYVAEKIAEEINNYGKKTSTECGEYSENECPDGCIVCPPCEFCSSLRCNSVEFCQSIGFSKEWYEAIKVQAEKSSKISPLPL